MASKLPYIQLFPGDWLRDGIAGCSLEAQGLWLRMLFIMHDSEKYGYLLENGKPIRPESAARRAGCAPAQYLALLTELTSVGVPATTPEGVIFSRRMIRNEKIRQVRKVAGKKGGIRSGKTRRKYIEANVKQNSESASMGLSPREREEKERSPIPPKERVEKEIPLSTGSLRESAVDSSIVIGGKSIYVIDTPLRRVVCAWKELTGYKRDNRGWDKLNWGRTAKTASALLEFFSDDWKSVIDCMEELSQGFRAKELSFTIETIAKHAPEWRIKQYGKV